MAGTQELLSAINNMQANTQAAMPVIPNNGNPGGVHNTSPATGQPPAVAAAPRPTGYEWLQPSPYMSMVNDMLKAKPQTPTQQPVMQAPQLEQPTAPVIPQRAF